MLDEIRDYLRTYDGTPIRIMEICGSHTGAIASNGIGSLLSERITLISGPGCPVCVTPSSYIDRLIRLAGEGKVIVTFGDLLRVPGSKKSLNEIGRAGQVRMVYSPLDVIPMALEEPEKEYVFAAVGFETTAPVYALLAEGLIERDIRNVKLLTAIKTMPEVVEQMLSEDVPVDAFMAPGHVCVVTGYRAFEPIAARHGVFFGVSGFTGKEILTALYGIVKNRGRGEVKNYYPSVVTADGNRQAQEKVENFFEKKDAAWRGLGIVPRSGYELRQEYRFLDAGSEGLIEDEKMNKACCCDKVLTGRMHPKECPLFGKVCLPSNPQGACMVSEEGSCFVASHFA